MGEIKNPYAKLSSEGSPFEELISNGVLWYINKHALHPIGYALAIHLDEDGKASGWSLVGDGSEPWQFVEETNQEKEEVFKQFLDLIGDINDGSATEG